MINLNFFDSSWHPAYVGRFYNGSFKDSGTYVRWWSSTSASSSGARNLYETTSGDIAPSDYYDRWDGFSGRCVANLRQRNSFDSSWHPAYVGYFTKGSFDNSGAVVNWWSGTSNASARAYFLSEHISDPVNPSSNIYDKAGFSGRHIGILHVLALCPQKV